MKFVEFMFSCLKKRFLFFIGCMKYCRKTNPYVFNTILVLDMVFFLLLLLVFFSSCGRDRKSVYVKADVDIEVASPSECPSGGYTVNGVPVCHGNSVGVSVSVDPYCVGGGHIVTFFADFDVNNVQSISEPTLGFMSVCNGESVNVMTASPSDCPYGGILVNGLPVCNGEPGAGVTVVNATPSECAAGGVVVNGTPICNGLNGANVQVVTLCPADTSPFAEKALLIGGELYAVLYSNQNAHPHNIGLVKMSPGTWATTTSGTTKIFTYSKTLSTITLTCDSISQTYTF